MQRTTMTVVDSINFESALVRARALFAKDESVIAATHSAREIPLPPITTSVIHGGLNASNSHTLPASGLNRKTRRRYQNKNYR